MVDTAFIEESANSSGRFQGKRKLNSLHVILNAKIGLLCFYFEREYACSRNIGL